MTLTSTLAGIGWDPEIRGIASVAVGVVVLMGSVYLLLATNLANRLGFMVAVTGFVGFMGVLGIIWWAYGIGMQGDTPQFVVREINYGDLSQAATPEVREVDESALPPPSEAAEINDLEPEELEPVAERINEQLGGGWELLPDSDGYFGEALTVAQEYLVSQQAAAQLGVESATDAVATYGLIRGGKAGLPDDPNRFDRIANWAHQTFVQIQHPTRYVVMQLQPVTEDSRPEAAAAGEPPPTPVPDESLPTISVVLVRDLGQERLPSALVTIGSFLVFGVLCFMLHKREQRVLIARGVLPAGTGA
jgi:hypothetical protein